jgi:hypothetical protein
LNFVEDFFGKTVFTSGDLQFRGAGDPVYGAVERIQDGLIGRVHADENGNAEHDAGDCESGSQQVLADVGPSDQAEEHQRASVCHMRRQRLRGC